METSSVIVVAGASEAEQLLLAGDIGCPGCNAALRPHGHGRTRTVRGVGATAVLTSLAARTPHAAPICTTLGPSPRTAPGNGALARNRTPSTHPDGAW